MSIVLDGDNLTTSGVINSSTAQASTSGTSIVFTVPTTAKRITVMFVGVSTNGSGVYQVQIGTGGAPTISGYVGSTTLFGASTLGTSSLTTGFGFTQQSTGTAYTFSGHYVLTLVGSNTWVGSGIVGRTDTAGSIIGGGSITLGGAINYLRIIGSNTGNPADTFDAGTINILYE